jgi:N-carbamoylputrescine amidase
MSRVRLALAQLASSPDRDRNLESCLESMRQAAALGAGIIAFPEVVLDRFFPQNAGDAAARELADPVPGPLTERIAGTARELGLVTVFNLYERTAEGRRFDSSPVFDADGTLLGVTRMVHITQYQHFFEQDYYDLGDHGAPVYDTAVGKVGVAICYDRHYPEYMRALGLAGAELVMIPQAGSVGEWPQGMYEAEVRTAAFQNGYYAALCNRVGVEEHLTFSGESFVSDPEGRIVARAHAGEEQLLTVEIDLGIARRSTARRLFWRDRRPELYREWLG